MEGAYTDASDGKENISLNLIINEAPVLPTLDVKDRRETAQLLASSAILASGRT
jgi:hypothetical protein